MVDHVRSLTAVSAVASTTVKTGDKSGITPSRTDSQSGPATLSKLVSMARALAEQGPPIDSAKVARVRQALADGTYHVDVEALASAMLRYGENEVQ